MISRYLIYVRPQHCSNCHAISHSKTIMAIEEENGKIRGSQTSTIDFRVPIGRTQLPAENIPVCDLCLSTFNTASLPVQATAEEFKATVRKKSEPPPVRVSITPEKKLVRVPDDFELPDLD